MFCNNGFLPHFLTISISLYQKNLRNTVAVANPQEHKSYDNYSKMAKSAQPQIVGMAKAIVAIPDFLPMRILLRFIFGTRHQI